MNSEVREVTEKKIWEDFLLSSSPNTFLQSWGWGKFADSIGRKYWRLGLFDNQKLVGISLVLKYSTRLGNYLYVPRGPILNWSDKKSFSVIFDKLKEIAVTQNCIFIKLDPLLEDIEGNREIFSGLGFKSAVTFVQVEDAWLLPLEKSEDELLASMRKTTRYLIRNEPKQGVRIDISTKQENMKKFIELLFSTAARKGFANHPKEYYLKQFEIFAESGQEKLFIAKRGNRVLSMAMIMFYGEMGYYLHAASNPRESGSVGYSLQWEAIKEAKKAGAKYYNFWGVVKDKNFHPGHPWYGFSLFKRGFGGFKYSYIRAQDYPMSNKYYVYRAAEKLRRLKNRIQTGNWED